MKLNRQILLLSSLLTTVGCSSTLVQEQVTLKSSGRVIDLVRGRSDVAVGDCGTQLNAWLFDEKGTLIDSKSERGHAIHCDLSVAIINAGATVGAANQIRRGIQSAVGDQTTVNNSNEQSQGQSQSQSQKVKGLRWNGGSAEGEGSGHGNNGNGNGSGDGSNPGTGHHHDNGDNN